MWVRTQLKIGWWDLAAGAAACLLPRDRADERARAESYFSLANDTIAAFSVRTAFDLLLQALRLQPGDEVIFSALNVKGMVRIVRDAGLVAIPVDVDVDRMSPSPEWLDAAITPRSRVFVAAHLFGARVDFDPLFRRARERGLIAVEDCAQAFNGKVYPGSDAADVNMFSFGPIKTATALGGALIRVRDPVLREQMRTIQATYTVQPEARQLKRVLQFMGLKLLTSRPVLGMIYRYHRAKGQDYEDALADRVREVAPLGTAKNLRHQPSTGMLALLNRRLANFKAEAIRTRKIKGEHLRDLIGGRVELPAQNTSHHDYWVFAFLVAEPRRFIKGLRAAGFDAADLPRSQHVAAPADRPELEPATAARIVRDIVVVPCYGAMPDWELERQANVIRRLADETPPLKP